MFTVCSKCMHLRCWIDETRKRNDDGAGVGASVIPDCGLDDAVVEQTPDASAAFVATNDASTGTDIVTISDASTGMDIAAVADASTGMDIVAVADASSGIDDRATSGDPTTA